MIVEDGKGQKDRVTMLPIRIQDSLRLHLRYVRLLHEGDLRAGFGAVYLPAALARKSPNAPRAWGWPYVFPAAQRSRDPRSGKTRRHRLHESAVQKAVRAAVRHAGIDRPASCHSLRPSSATHLLEDGYEGDVRAGTGLAWSGYR